MNHFLCDNLADFNKAKPFQTVDHKTNNTNKTGAQTGKVSNVEIMFIIGS